MWNQASNVAKICLYFHLEANNFSFCKVLRIFANSCAIPIFKSKILLLFAQCYFKVSEKLSNTALFTFN